MRELERRVVLSVIDRRWRDHLYEMDYLKDGIGLRAMAQRDPLVEYQREGFALYQNMMGAIREESVGFLFNLEVEVTGGDGAARVAAKRSRRAGQPRRAGFSYSAPSADAPGRGRGAQPARPARAAPRPRAPSRRSSARRMPRSARRSARAAVSRAAASRAAGQQAPAQGGQQGGARGAFGQRTDGQPAPTNRAERRAQEKRR